MSKVGFCKALGLCSLLCKNLKAQNSVFSWGLIRKNILFFWIKLIEVLLQIRKWSLTELDKINCFWNTFPLQEIWTMPNTVGAWNGCVFPWKEKEIRFVLTFSGVGKTNVVTTLSMLDSLGKATMTMVHTEQQITPSSSLSSLIIELKKHALVAHSSA